MPLDAKKLLKEAEHNPFQSNEQFPARLVLKLLQPHKSVLPEHILD